MNFSELLNRPLSDALDILKNDENVQKSTNNTNDDVITETTVIEDFDTKVVDDDGETEPNEDDESEDVFDLSSLDDHELSSMNKEISGNALGTIADDGESMRNTRLLPDEEMEADDMMSVAATSHLLRRGMNDTQRLEFLKDKKQLSTAINEGFLTESVVNDIMRESNMIESDNRSGIHTLGVLASAAANNSDNWAKYKKVLKLESVLLEKMELEYAEEADVRESVYFSRLKNSKSNALQKLAK